MSSFLLGPNTFIDVLFLSIANSEIEGKAETLKDGTLKKPELYNVGQTVTCFVKKVRSEDS